MTSRRVVVNRVPARSRRPRVFFKFLHPRAVITQTTRSSTFHSGPKTGTVASSLYDTVMVMGDCPRASNFPAPTMTTHLAQAFTQSLGTNGVQKRTHHGQHLGYLLILIVRRSTLNLDLSHFPYFKFSSPPCETSFSVPGKRAS